MEAIEFQTFLGKDRIIKVPEAFNEKINEGKVRVIILAEEEKNFNREDIYDRESDRAQNYIKWLIKNPLKVAKSVPFLTRDEIYDRKL